MRFIHTLAALSSLVLATATSAASAAAIDVQFSRDNGATQSGAAVIGSSGDYWNDFIGSASGSGTLLDTSGANSGASLTFSSALVYESIMGFTQFTGTPHADLMQGYLVDFMNSPGIDLKFSGLTAGQQYGFWVYTQGDDNSTNRQISLTANGGATQVATQTNAATFKLGDNLTYIVSMADADGVVDIVGRDLNGEANINGVQVMAVPEPSIAVLMMAAFAFFAGATVRRSHARVR
jgi:hypothetical protein